MSLTPTTPKRRWRWALFLGGTLGLVSTLTADLSPEFRLAYSLRHLADPGLFLRGLITSAGLGGGGDLETWLVSIPINVALYTLLLYGIISGVAKLPAMARVGIGAALGVALIAIFVPKIQKHNHYAILYGSLKQGTTKTEVLQKWGPPAFLGVCKPFVKWDSNPIPPGTKNCVEELWYSSPLTPETWGIGFDADRHAISKYHWPI